MKLVSTQKDQLVFHLGRRERDLLFHLAGLYPCIPPAHRQLSKTAKFEPASQQLLEEALAEQRQQNKKELQRLLADPKRWTENHGGWRLKLKPLEIESLLQILNDVRIGSWVQLGSPEKSVEILDEQTVPHLWAMELAGSFEMALLHALEKPS